MMRRTCVSAAVALFGDQSFVAKQDGHSQSMLSSQYQTWMTEEEARRILRIEEDAEVEFRKKYLHYTISNNNK